MALNVSKIKGNGGERVEQPNIDPGTYPARVVQIIDLGLQPQRPYQGKDKPPANEIMLTYEMVDEFMVDADGNPVEDKPRWISETMPLHGLFAEKAKSTQRYMALDPKKEFGGDFAALIGTATNITVINNPGKDGKVYDNIASISTMRPRDVASCPELVNPPKVFDSSEPDMEVFNALPSWIQDKIKGNLNYEGSALQAVLEGAPKATNGKMKAKIEKIVPEEDGNDNPY